MCWVMLVVNIVCEMTSRASCIISAAMSIVRPCVVFHDSQSVLAHLGHAIGHRRHPGAVKDRLDDSSMAFPDLTGTGHQAITQD